MLKISSTTQANQSPMQQLRMLRMSAGERKKIHRWLGRQVITKSRARIKKQQDLQGHQFKARSYNSRKRFLKNMMKGSRIKAYVGPSKATVTWPNSRTGSIARNQQEGFKQRFTKKTCSVANPIILQRLQTFKQKP